jgi:glycerol-3-phosphate dehydrogenase
METFELLLVRKLCVSRNHLIRSYPSTVEEIRFLVVHERGFRHGLWKLVLGTWLYWLIGSFFTRRPRKLDVTTLAREEPIIAIDRSDGGFEYSDAYLHDNDARFVWNFVRSALNHDAQRRTTCSTRGGSNTRARLVQAARRDPLARWSTCGPCRRDECPPRSDFVATRSQSIHLIVPASRTSACSHLRRRRALFFVIPMGPRTCVGTTDTGRDRH